MQLGIDHAPHANITGQGLHDLQNDPSVQAAEDKMVAQIRSDPHYGQQAYAVPGDKFHENFTADGSSRNWFIAGLEGNQAFYMVHTAQLYATDTKVSANGIISTTWKVEDTFDYVPAWDDQELRSGSNYWAYNIEAEIVGLYYYGVRHAEKKLQTNAYWNQTVYPSVKNSSKLIPQ